MSQKLISSFLKPKNSGKRKFDEIEDQNNYESKTKKNGPDSSANERAIIIETAKKKPALSPNIGLTWFKALEKEFAQEYFERHMRSSTCNMIWTKCLQTLSTHETLETIRHVVGISGVATNGLGGAMHLGSQAQRDPPSKPNFR
ncbi:uracil-DNA glycosylase [Trichonephila clavipes]|nr:uracil-DNA glycosylase [Trichonephila clavipes]